MAKIANITDIEVARLVASEVTRQLSTLTNKLPIVRLRTH